MAGAPLKRSTERASIIGGSGRPTVQLLVRGHARTITVDGVSLTDDVAALEAAVAAKAQVPQESSWLGFAGRRLEAGHPLSYYGLRAGATLHLAVRGRGGGCAQGKLVVASNITPEGGQAGPHRSPSARLFIAESRVHLQTRKVQFAESPITEGGSEGAGKAEQESASPAKAARSGGRVPLAKGPQSSASGTAGDASGRIVKVTTDKKIDSAYIVDKDELGSGSFAIVKKCKKKADASVYAVKIIDKSKVEDMNDLTREVDIMSHIDHPHIVRLYEVYDEPKVMHLVLELLEGGELFDRIVEQGRYTEKDAARMISQLASALEYIHARKIYHRDLKPENILLASTAHDAPIKVTDFGLARTMSGEEMMKTACGTPGYVAPEVLRNKGYSTGAVDMWSAGVILYTILCGFPPFYEEELPDLFNQIMAAEYDFPSPEWDFVSADAKDLVKNLLMADTEKRMRADQVEHHPWIKNAEGATSVMYTASLDMAKGGLERYQSTRSVKKLGA